MNSGMPAFSMYSNGQLCVLTQNIYSSLLKQFLAKLGIPTDNYSSHSVRRGSASFMFMSQVPTQLLKQHGTWKSEAFNRYIDVSYKQRLIPTQKMFTKINSLFGNP